MAVRNVCRQMRQHALPAAADAGFCLKFFPSASRPDKRGSRQIRGPHCGCRGSLAVPLSLG